MKFEHLFLSHILVAVAVLLIPIMTVANHWSWLPYPQAALLVRVWGFEWFLFPFICWFWRRKGSVSQQISRGTRAFASVLIFFLIVPLTFIYMLLVDGVYLPAMVILGGAGVIGWPVRPKTSPTVP